MRPFSPSFRQHLLAATACASLLLLSAEASAALVQTSGKKVNSGWSTSITENAASNFTVGNTVIVSVAFYGSAADITSVEIAGTTATRAIRSSATWNGGEVSSIIYFAKVVNSGRSDVVINGDTNFNGTSLSIDEWSELQDNPVDKTGSAGPTTSTSPSASSGALSQSGEVVYFALGYYNTDQASITAPSGYTNVFEELTGTANAGGAAYYRVVSSTASEAPTATLDTADIWTAAIATFKLALGKPTGVTATPGFGSATVSFGPPFSDGGSPITGYTATCGSQSNTGATSPITVGGLPNGVPVTCTVFATNGGGNGPSSDPSNSAIPNGPIVNITGIPAAANEGSPSGFTGFTYTLTRTGPAAAFNVTYTITGDVVSGEDYSPVTGTVAFTAAQTTRTITVGVFKDTKFEIDENLTLTLTGATGGASIGAFTVGTTQVLNDDTVPTVSIGNATVIENNTTANFSVTLSNASYLPVTVTATTLNQTASDTAAPFAVSDYVAASGPVTFNPGVVLKTFPVTINQDTLYETAVNETFAVNLTSPVNATILVSQGIGSITDNDAKPTVSVSGGAANQAESVSSYVFTVTLNRPSVETISVIPVTVDGTASATAAPFPQADYLALPGSMVTFAPNETSKTVTVTLIDDAIDEAASETFSVQLTSLVNVDPGTLSRTGTINDNDAAPLLTITAPAPVGEESGPAVFTISLSAISGLPVSVNAATAPTPGTATSGVDYTATGPQAFTWTPGTNASQSFNVALLPDLLNEANETFRVNLSGNVNAGFTAGGSLANATIVDNDPIPTLSINDVSQAEGNAGTSLFTFTLTLSAPSGRTVQVGASTVGQTAAAPSDYVHVSATNVVFPPGTTTQPFSVTVNGDLTIEPNETFLVNVFNPVNVTISDNQGLGTILNDESPALSINDVTLVEGNGPGTTNMNFTVSISLPAPPSGAGFTYVTSGLSATEGTDYVGQGPTTGAITAGNTTTTISIPINGDTAIEGAETFSVTLSNPTGTQVTILDGLGIGTIQNDDAVPSGSLLISEFRTKGPAGPADEFIEIANPTSNPVTVYATNLSGGFSVADATGARVFTIPDGTTIPARGHFLAANNTPAVGYSLGGYGGGALPDATWTNDVADDLGLALFDTANPAFYGTATAYDAVGFTTDATPYREGTGLNGIGTGATANNHSFVRKHLFGGGSGLQDTNDNATDWVLVATDAGLYGATNAVLGGPSPENLAAENELSNTQLTISSGPGGTVAFPGPPKALEFRRTFTNNTGGTLNAIRFKVTSITGINNTVPGQADLRPTTSTTAAGFLGLTLESPPNYPLVTLSTPPGTLPIGGLGSTLRLNSGLPLLNGAAVNVNFRVEYTLSGASFYYWLVPEAK